MTALNLSERFNQSTKGLNQRLYEHIIKLPNELKIQAQEIRLRVNRPVSIYCGRQTYFVTESYQFTTTVLRDKMLMATQRDIAETFQNICCYSVYSRQNEIKNGFVTMHGGHRAGICGTAVYNDDRLTNIRDISSINIRISKEINGAADKLIKALNNNMGGVLICGAPSSGKTTILRDLARQLSVSYGLKVSVVDERGELGGTCNGILQNDLGYCDVLDGYLKGEGIMQAVRCLSPQVVICDEVGNSNDAVAIEESLNAGVAVIASIHGKKENFIRRPQVQRLMNTGAFSKLVFLKSSETPGEIEDICTWEEIKNVTTCRSIYDNCKHSVVGDIAVQATDYQSLVL
ncbi:MAG TPA: stage III sporulation protein AA [Clostridiales bacterium]|nr:stage III sporulation protein AA [Clostridiales bacterium]